MPKEALAANTVQDMGAVNVCTAIPKNLDIAKKKNRYFGGQSVTYTKKTNALHSDHHGGRARRQMVES